jgi:GxxExxY protein
MEKPDVTEVVPGGRAIRDRQTYAIIGAAMEVHRCLGSGFLEPVYQAALEVELGKRGVPHQREIELPVYYKEEPLGVRYRADFICFGQVLVELKALERVTKREESQVIHYLIASRLGRGLLLNFGTPSLQYRRLVGPKLQSVFKSVESVDQPS